MSSSERQQERHRLAQGQIADTTRAMVIRACEARDRMIAAGIVELARCGSQVDPKEAVLAIYSAMEAARNAG